MGASFPKKRPTEMGTNVVGGEIDQGWYVSAKPPARAGGRVPSKPPAQLVGGEAREPQALSCSDGVPLRILKAIVAAIRPFRHLIVLI